ncbi:response regulator [Tichowtungia aerotolerans]|uniref:Response regulator n=1 Tax=Tichowtungia aerotolerans TaxID=2697043 RepID=A0A6P1M8E8_9BACT|nr:response regulator [Tichowtungia aerotolerans]QHI70312.1 response regulator [Tichowtungia aerotolerans]
MKKILLVDDEAAIRSMLSVLLKTDTRSFVEAPNGTVAQEILASDSFDLIISDVIMPDCDGIELVMAIRRKLPEVPVIIMSGGGRVHASHYLNLAEKLGAARVFEKPFDATELRSTVTELLDEAETVPQT